LWAIWFCLLVSVSSCEIDRIQESTLDDTYLMCLNSILYISTNNNLKQESLHVTKRQPLKIVIDNFITNSINYNLLLKEPLQKLFARMHSTDDIISILHNNINAHTLINNKLECMKKSSYGNKTLNEFIPIFRETMGFVAFQINYIEKGFTCIANYANYNNYDGVEEMRIKFASYLTSHKQFIGSLMIGPQNIAINQMSCDI
jgi:hypothetical protein